METSDLVVEALSAGELPRGRTAPLDPAAADRLFREGVALFEQFGEVAGLPGRGASQRARRLGLTERSSTLPS